MRHPLEGIDLDRLAAVQADSLKRSREKLRRVMRGLPLTDGGKRIGTTVHIRLPLRYQQNPDVGKG